MFVLCMPAYEKSCDELLLCFVRTCLNIYLMNNLMRCLREPGKFPFGRYSSHTYSKIGNEYRTSNFCVNPHLCVCPFTIQLIVFCCLKVMCVL